MFSRSGNNKFETSRVANVEVCYVEWLAVWQYRLIPDWTHTMPQVAISAVIIRRIRKIAKSCYLLRHACLSVSVRPHGTPRLPLGEFSW